jgi:hypothetical protein
MLALAAMKNKKILMILKMNLIVFIANEFIS